MEINNWAFREQVKGIPKVSPTSNIGKQPSQESFKEALEKAKKGRKENKENQR